MPLAISVLASCAYYKGTGDMHSCYDMHRFTADIKALSEQVSDLEKKRISLSRDAERNYEAIRSGDKLILDKRKKIEDLEKESRRLARSCEPMFEDPATERARQQGYGKD